MPDVFFVYNAEVLCSDCGYATQLSLEPDPDSELYPQGPYYSQLAEVDSPNYCGICGELLPMNLIGDGEESII